MSKKKHTEESIITTLPKAGIMQAKVQPLSEVISN
jgi:hypothetical protein